jgi:hypothetical protein
MRDTNWIDDRIEAAISANNRRWRGALLLAAVVAVPVSLAASTVGSLVSFTNGTVADADEVNANFATLRDAVDDNQAQLDAMSGGSGMVVDFVYAQDNGQDSLNGTFPWDGSVPQKSEGNRLMGLTIAPKAAGNLLVFDAITHYREPANHSDHFVLGLFVEGQSDAIATAVGPAGSAGCSSEGTYGYQCQLALRFVLPASHTDALEYEIRGGLNAGNVHINKPMNASIGVGATMHTSMSITEIAQEPVCAYKAPTETLCTAGYPDVVPFSEFSLGDSAGCGGSGSTSGFGYANIFEEVGFDVQVPGAYSSGDTLSLSFTGWASGSTGNVAVEVDVSDDNASWVPAGSFPAKNYLGNSTADTLDLTLPISGTELYVRLTTDVTSSALLFVRGFEAEFQGVCP